MVPTRKWCLRAEHRGERTLALMTQERITQRQDRGWLLDVSHSTCTLMVQVCSRLGHRQGSRRSLVSQGAKWQSATEAADFQPGRPKSVDPKQVIHNLLFPAGVTDGLSGTGPFWDQSSGWTRLQCWLWKWASAVSLNLNTIHFVNDITCLQRQKLRSSACGREKTGTVFWWNPRIGDIMVLSEFREEPAACELTVKLQAALQMEHLCVHTDHYQTPSKLALIATLSAMKLWSQSRIPPHTHTHI